MTNGRPRPGLARPEARDPKVEGMSSNRARPAWVALAGAAALVVVAFAIPPLLDWEVWSRAPRSASNLAVPPLHGLWEPTWLGPGTAPALALAIAAVAWGDRLARSLTWPRLLALSYAASAGWLLSLAFVDGATGVSRVLGGPYEYLRSARAVTDVPAMISTYIDRIPIDAPNAWPTQPAGHPPLALLFFVLLDRVGLGGSFAAGLVVTLVGASASAGVLVTLRALGAEREARMAAPFLVFAPAAVFMAVSADALFTAVGAWGLACLALAATARRPAWAIGWAVSAGLLLGSVVMMSYGLTLLGIPAVAVLMIARRWQPLPIAAAAASTVVLAFAAAGFAWWEAFPALRERYWDGIANDRPASYWLWANLAALVVCAGPLVAAGIAQVVAAIRSKPGGGTRVVTLLVVAAAACVVLADASLMSKAEVERIWLPFVPWLLVSTALLDHGWRRPGLALQACWAIVLEHALYTTW